MSELSPIDASMLALLAENRKSPDQVKLLLGYTSPAVKGIAKSIVSPRARVSKTDRKVAAAIRRWADTNKIKVAG